MKNRILKILFATVICFSIVLLTMPMSMAVGTNGSCGDSLTWVFNESIGELKIEGSGEMDSFSYVDESMKADSPWAEILDSIKKVTVDEGVTGISKGSFAQAVNLKEAVLPSTLSEISEAAFYGCSSLSKITISDGVAEIRYHAFEKCTSLESVVIPNSVTYIGESAFEGCTSLKNVRLPDYPIDFHQDIFRDCTALKSITIPDGCTYINSHTFRGCKSLESITIPSSVTTICLTAFWSCKNFKDIYYAGSEDEWNNVEVTEKENSANFGLGEEFLNATVHFNSDVDAGALAVGNDSGNNIGEDKENGNENGILPIICIAGGAVLVGGVAATVVLMMKKKK